MPRPRLSQDAPKVVIVRTPPALLDGVDEMLADQRKKRGPAVSRADVIRDVLTRAVKAHRRRRAPKR